MDETYTTIAGDRLDLIIWDHYGGDPARLSGLLTLVLEANRGLAEHGVILPAGVAILLPAAADAPATKTTVRMWD